MAGIQYLNDRFHVKWMKTSRMRGKGPGFHKLTRNINSGVESLPITRLSGVVKPANNQTLRVVARGRAGRYTLEGRSRGAFSGGEIQRLRRLRQEGHTPTVLVAVSD